MSHPVQALFVNSTISVRLKWELTKEKFDSCEFDQQIYSKNYFVQVGTKTSEWAIVLCPKGDEEENKVAVYIELMKGEGDYDVLFGFGVKTGSGYWPDGDLIEKLYSNTLSNEDSNKTNHIFNLEREGGEDWGFDDFCKTKDFRKKFVKNKLTFVATLVFRMEGKRYLQQKKVEDDFVKDMRSLSIQENLSDVIIISSGKKFPSHKVLLAARSKYFEALFRHEKEKKEVTIEHVSPDIVEALLDFMSKGLIPSDIDAQAVDLLELADMYQIELLSQVCLNSMVDNLSPDNALQTLVTVDKLKHISDSDQRDKILAFIKKEKRKIVKGENWEGFMQSYPNLVTEMFLSL